MRRKKLWSWGEAYTWICRRSTFAHWLSTPGRAVSSWVGTGSGFGRIKERSFQTPLGNSLHLSVVSRMTPKTARAPDCFQSIRPKCWWTPQSGLSCSFKENPPLRKRPTLFEGTTSYRHLTAISEYLINHLTRPAPSSARSPVTVLSCRSRWCGSLSPSSPRRFWTKSHWGVLHGRSLIRPCDTGSINCGIGRRLHGTGPWTHPRSHCACFVRTKPKRLARRREERAVPAAKCRPTEWPAVPSLLIKPLNK